MYWMQRTVRTHDNLALEAAIWLADRVGLDLIVVVSTKLLYSLHRLYG